MKDGIATGFDIELMRAVCGRVSLELRPLAYTGEDFNGIFAGLAQGKCDVVISGTTITPDRAALVRFSRPYLEFNQGIAVNRRLTPDLIRLQGAVSGFGARRQKSEARSYVVFYRTRGGRQRWHTIGRHGAPWTPELARNEAIKILGRVAEGEDPAADKQRKRRAATVSELCDFYLADAEAGRILTRFRRPKKAATLALDRGRIDRHIKPLIGKLQVATVTTTDIEYLLHDIAAGKTAATVATKPRGLARVRGGKATATRVVRFLGAVFSYAIMHKMRGDNPVRGVTQFEDGQKRRRLSGQEYRALGAALANIEKTGLWPAAVAATRFVALSGWRSGEALGLRWGATLSIALSSCQIPKPARVCVHCQMPRLPCCRINTAWASWFFQPRAAMAV
jgi:ABC-type amino acid transport substrate-binding protein